MRVSVGSDHEKNEPDDSEDDEGVGEIERRPEVEVDEVGHVTAPGPIEEIGDAAADHQSERSRQQRMARS